MTIEECGIMLYSENDNIFYQQNAYRSCSSTGFQKNTEEYLMPVADNYCYGNSNSISSTTNVTKVLPHIPTEKSTFSSGIYTTNKNKNESDKLNCGSASYFSPPTTINAINRSLPQPSIYSKSPDDVKDYYPYENHLNRPTSHQNDVNRYAASTDFDPLGKSRILPQPQHYTHIPPYSTKEDTMMQSNAPPFSNYSMCSLISRPSTGFDNTTITNLQNMELNSHSYLYDNNETIDASFYQQRPHTSMEPYDYNQYFG